MFGYSALASWVTGHSSRWSDRGPVSWGRSPAVRSRWTSWNSGWVFRYSSMKWRHRVLDGAAALMLTGETAIGKHPVEAMTYLAKTARCAMRDMEEMQTQEET